MRKSSKKIEELLRAKDNLVYVLTYEENSFIEEICHVVRNMSLNGGIPQIKVYTPPTGMVTVSSISSPCEYDPNSVDKNIRNVIDALQYVRRVQSNLNTSEPSVMDRLRAAPEEKDAKSQQTIFIFKDIHQYFQQKEVVRLIRDIAEEYRNKVYCPIFVTSPVLELPPELEKIFTLYEMPLMDKEDLRFIVQHTRGNIAGETVTETVNRENALVDAFAGLTYREVIRAICHCKAKYEDKAVRPEEIHKEKVAIVRKSGALDFIVPNHKLSDLGGCEAFKDWVVKIKERFTSEAKKFGIAEPKGAMLVGVPGTSKTVSAEILASYLNVPLLGLDMAKVMGSFVGQSERQIANALRIAKSVAPCVLLLDECEKVLSGVNSSASCDAGTLSRVMSQLLNFLQEDNTGVITIMTSNDVSQLPPELTRTGRIDAQWMFDLPTKEERDEIVDIYINKSDLDMNNIVKEYLVVKTENFTGAEIKTTVENVTANIFFRQKRESVSTYNRIATKEDIDAAISMITPVYISSREKIEAFRTFAKDRYLNASAPVPKPDKQKPRSLPWANFGMSGHKILPIKKKRDDA